MVVETGSKDRRREFDFVWGDEFAAARAEAAASHAASPPFPGVGVAAGVRECPASKNDSATREQRRRLPVERLLTVGVQTRRWRQHAARSGAIDGLSPALNDQSRGIPVVRKPAIEGVMPGGTSSPGQEAFQRANSPDAARKHADENVLGKLSGP